MKHYTCPACQHYFRVPEGRGGSGAGCPRCGNRVLAMTPPRLGSADLADLAEAAEEELEWLPPPLGEPTPPLLPSADLEPSPDADLQADTYPISTGPSAIVASRPPQPPHWQRPSKLCYRCGASIDARAELCHRCGTALPLEDYGLPERRFDLEPHRGGVILTLGLLAFLVPFVFGPLAWTLAERDLHKMIDGTMDPDGERLTRLGLQFGMAATAIALLLLVTALLICVPVFLAGL